MNTDPEGKSDGSLEPWHKVVATLLFVAGAITMLYGLAAGDHKTAKTGAIAVLAACLTVIELIRSDLPRRIASVLLFAVILILLGKINDPVGTMLMLMLAMGDVAFVAIVILLTGRR